MKIWIWLPSTPFLIGLLIFSFVSFWLTLPLVAYIVFVKTMKRSSREKWGRNTPNDEQAQRDMYAVGMKWMRDNQDKRTELHIVNEGLNLFGEYFDLGYDRAVIVVTGRTESLRYGYYFAKPYVESGYNLLVIDQRAHGDSDGKYNTIGFNEHRDLIAWSKLLHERFGVRSIVLHGLCIGSSCSLFALTSKDCPEYIDALVAEGMYPTFYESFKNHMIVLNKPVFPFMALINMWMKLLTGCSMKYGPIHVIGDYKKPLLMIHSREDLYSLPTTAVTLFEKAGSEHKEIVWFEKGKHSQLRITDPYLYYTAIKNFLTRLDEEKSNESEKDSMLIGS